MADSKSINLLELAPGMRVRLDSGEQMEIVENPGDGMWIICKSADLGSIDSNAERPVFAGNVIEILGQS